MLRSFFDGFLMAWRNRDEQLPAIAFVVGGAIAIVMLTAG